MKKLNPSYALACFLIALNLNAQQIVKSVKPFSHPYFIENLGQFNGRDNSADSKIMYGSINEGVQYFFTPNGLTYRIDKFEKETPSFIRELFMKGKENEMVKKASLVNMEWVGANPNCGMVVTNSVKEYFNYSDEKPDGKATNYNFAKAYQKLLYKNLYPNIDVEYTFHPVTGIKYNIILHPGADASQIKMRYSSQKNIWLQNGDIHFTNKHGEYIDHAPSNTYYQNNPSQKIICSFKLSGNTVSFNLGNYNSNQTIVIDPWTAVPTAMNNTTAYNCDQDAQGNVYVFGGSNTFMVQKFDNTGAPLWTYNPNYFSYIGDLKLDFAGNAYICEGFSSGNRAKLSPAGTLLWSNTGGLPETWTMAFNTAKDTLYVAGHDMPGNNTQGMIGRIDLTTGAIVTSFVYLNELHSICTDPFGDIYGLSTGLILQGSPPSQFFKVRANLVADFQTNNGYAIDETTPNYANGSVQGSNGICADHCFAYTTVGNTLDKRCKSTGAIVSTVNLTGGTLENNSGIAVDSCGNIYVGTSSSVIKFDNNLNVLQTANTTGNVYDVQIGLNGEIIACGVGFVATINMSACGPVSSTGASGSVSVTGVGCNNLGSATVNFAQCGGNLTYSWSNGQTTQTATGLSMGTYTVVVTATGGQCNTTGGDTLVVTIGPSNGGPVVAAATTVNLQCFGGTTGSANITTSSGTAPFTYQWSNSATTQNVTGLAAGNYSVIVTDATGCTDTVFFTLNQPPDLVLNTGVAPCQLEQNNGSTFVNVTGGNPGYTYVWNTVPPQANDTATAIGPGAYMVYVIDNNGCADSALAIIDECPVDSIYIPNVFSPNADGTNDNFFIYNKGYNNIKVDIYNRWGELLHTFDSVTQFWDGTHKGKRCSDGTYFFVAHAEKYNGELKTYKGYVQLMTKK
jgi:gliding motility-associated-like protein